MAKYVSIRNRNSNLVDVMWLGIPGGKPSQYDGSGLMGRISDTFASCFATRLGS